MNQYPEVLRKQYSESLLGRLRLKIFELISGDERIVPAGREIRKYVVGTYRSNPAWGDIVMDLLKVQSHSKVSYRRLPLPESVADLIRRLEHDPLEEATFVEVENYGFSGGSTLGVLVRREHMKLSGYVYALNLISENDFPESICGRIKVRACQQEPDPMFSVLAGRAYKHYGLENWSDSKPLALAARTLSYLHNEKSALLEISDLPPLEKDFSSINPPEDPALARLLVGAYKEKVPCAKTSVPLKLIRPHDLDFCLQFPVEIVVSCAKYLAERPKNPPPLLVYWRDDHFVMSDDYPFYLAYRKLKLKRIPVVVLGEVPNIVASSIKRGGPELIPAITVSKKPDESTLSTEMKEFVLDQRLSRAGSKSGDLLFSLYAMYITLSKMIQSAATTERELHKLLADHPVILDPHGFGVMTEVWLGREYRVDLVFLYPFSEKRILLIELEKASKKIFTKSGRPRAEVTHAVQQVEDWLRWWKENPTLIREPLDGTVTPQGLVVIGSNQDMTEAQKRRLLHLNSHRSVQVVTYDDLLNRLDGLISNLNEYVE